MKEYFKLQYKMTNRKIADFGLHPVIGYLLLLLVFSALSLYLFYKTAFAPYIYILVALFLVTRLNENKRNDFLKTCFSNQHYKLTRIWENLLIICPFVLFLLYNCLFYPAIILTVLSIPLALVNFKNTYNITLPTPFAKKPFEFTVGFRENFSTLEGKMKEFTIGNKINKLALK